MKRPFLFRSPSIHAAAACLMASFASAQIPQETLDDLMTTLQGDDYPARYEARMELQDFVSQASMPGNEAERQAIEAQLVELLLQPHPETTRLWLLRQIESIGSKASLEALDILTTDANRHVADGARRALEVNPAGGANTLLQSALTRSDSDAERVALINSLAQRGDASASPALVPYLQSESLAVAEAAGRALSRLGYKAAADPLQAALPGATGQRRLYAELALLALSSDRALMSALAQDGSSRAVQSAAFRRLTALRSGEARSLLRDVLASDDILKQIDFLQVAMNSGKAALRREAIRQLDALAPAGQSVILGGLDAKDASRELEATTLALAQSDNEQLQIQAIEALGRYGSIRSLPLLLESLASRSRSLREAAADAIARVPDSRIDRQLLRDARSGSLESQVTAITALSYRASAGAVELVNQIAADPGAEENLRAEAIAALERIGTTDSLGLLVDIAVDEPAMRRPAQLTLKRMTLRVADPPRAWDAFQTGLSRVEPGSDAHFALLAVLDSAPTSDAIAYAKETWSEGDARIQNAILKVLPLWRNWDGGFALLDLAGRESATPEQRDACFQGIGRLILGSDATFPREEKFELAGAALDEATSPEQRSSVINGFRYSEWRERVYVTYNEVDPELKEAVLKFAED